MDWPTAVTANQKAAAAFNALKRRRAGKARDDLASAQWATLEDALWAAVRGMEENAELSSRLARMAEESGSERRAERHRDRGAELQAQSRVIREFLLRPGSASTDAEMPDQDREAVRARR